MPKTNQPANRLVYLLYRVQHTPIHLRHRLCDDFPAAVFVSSNYVDVLGYVLLTLAHYLPLRTCF